MSNFGKPKHGSDGNLTRFPNIIFAKINSHKKVLNFLFSSLFSMEKGLFARFLKIPGGSLQNLLPVTAMVKQAPPGRRAVAPHALSSDSVEEASPSRSPPLRTLPSSSPSPLCSFPAGNPRPTPPPHAVAAPALPEPPRAFHRLRRPPLFLLPRGIELQLPTTPPRPRLLQLRPPAAVVKFGASEPSPASSTPQGASR